MPTLIRCEQLRAAGLLLDFEQVKSPSTSTGIFGGVPLARSLCRRGNYPRYVPKERTIDQCTGYHCMVKKPHTPHDNNLGSRAERQLCEKYVFTRIPKMYQLQYTMNCKKTPASC